MQKIGRERLDELEEECGEEVNAVLFCASPSGSNSLPELKAIAKSLGIPEGDFATLVEAKRDALRRIKTADPVPNCEVMAGHLGMTLEEYFGWLDKQSEIFDSIRIVDEDDLRRQQSLFPDPWEEEEDLLDDLQQDAGLQGD